MARIHSHLPKETHVSAKDLFLSPLCILNAANANSAVLLMSWKGNSVWPGASNATVVKPWIISLDVVLNLLQTSPYMLLRKQVTLIRNLLMTLFALWPQKQSTQFLVDQFMQKRIYWRSEKSKISSRLWCNSKYHSPEISVKEQANWKIRNKTHNV